MDRRLAIVGRGPLAERLAELAAHLGYAELSVGDDLPSDLGADDHLIIAVADAPAARTVLLAASRLGVLPAYVGLAATHSEGWKATVALAAAGVPKDRIDRLAAPAGVDIGAETPAEIAIAVAAELVAVIHGRRAEQLPPGEDLPRTGRMIGRRGKGQA